MSHQAEHVTIFPMPRDRLSHASYAFSTSLATWGKAMNSLLDSWLLKVQDVSNSIQAKKQQLAAQLDENEGLEIDLVDELRRRAAACKSLDDLRIQHAQLHSKALLCVGEGQADCHTSRSIVTCCSACPRPNGASCREIWYAAGRGIAQQDS